MKYLLRSIVALISLFSAIFIGALLWSSHGDAIGSIGSDKPRRLDAAHGTHPRQLKNVIAFGGAPPADKLPLQECEGDCDNDDDCNVGLICFQRERNETVPGCLGGSLDPTPSDYCIVPADGSNVTTGRNDNSTDAPTPNNSQTPTQYPSESTSPSSEFSPSSRPITYPTLQPTTACEGNGPVYGVFDDMKPRQVVGYSGTPAPCRYPLRRCEGDCDRDSDCEGDLVCFQRESFTSVPGCLGGDADYTPTDFCISLSHLPSSSPTASPTVSPTSSPSARVEPSSLPLVPSVPPESTLKPTQRPTPPPSESRTPFPTRLSTSIPTLPPTRAPNSPPTSHPITDPTSGPNSSPSANCEGIEASIYAAIEDDMKSRQIVGYGGKPGPCRIPLLRCEGDCDRDSDCDGDLVCFQRGPSMPVPGCLGGDADYTPTDFCISLTHLSSGSSTASPTSSPSAQAIKEDADSASRVDTGSPPVPTRPRVAAYLYNWYSPSQWNKWKTLYPPTEGLYSSRDKAVLETHSRWAKQAGIDYFVVSWGTAHDHENTLFYLEQESTIPIVLHMESLSMYMDATFKYQREVEGAQTKEPYRGSMDFTSQARNVFIDDDSFATTFGDVFTEYFFKGMDEIILPNREKYVFIQGRPVFVVYLARDFQNYENYVRSLRQAFEARYGVQPYLIADMVWFEHDIVKLDRHVESKAHEIYDSFTAYNRYEGKILSETLDEYILRMEDEYELYSNLQNENDNDDSFRTLMLPYVQPGYDDTLIRGGLVLPGGSRTVISRNGGRTYDEFWNHAERILRLNACDGVHPDELIVFVCTFNEWHESTSIEPSTVWGEQYLDMTFERSRSIYPQCRADTERLGPSI